MPVLTIAKAIEKPKTRFRIPRIAKEINLLHELFVDYEEQVCGLLEKENRNTDLRGLLKKNKKAR